MKKQWVDQQVRDEVVDFVKHWQTSSGIALKRVLSWVSVPPQRYYDWKDRYGMANEHNALIPRDHWLEQSEKDKIIAYHVEYPLCGYRRLCYMMNDADIVAVSPSTVRNVLKAAGLLDRKRFKASRKGSGFHQPSGIHKHWHIDVTYINISGTFFYMSSILDGYSRMIVDWVIDEKMHESDIEILIERAKEKYPGVKPRIISDNGPQFVAKDFKDFVRISGMTHVRTSPFYPQSNGKIEAMHKTLKNECIRPKAPRSFEEANKLVEAFVEHYNNERLHSGIGYVTPRTKFLGEEDEVFRLRDERLEKAREDRKQRRRAIREQQFGCESEVEPRDEKSSPSGATSEMIKSRVASLVDDVITIGNLTSTGDELGSKLLLENRKEVEKL